MDGAPRSATSRQSAIPRSVARPASALVGVRRAAAHRNRRRSRAGRRRQAGGVCALLWPAAFSLRGAGAVGGPRRSAGGHRRTARHRSRLRHRRGGRGGRGGHRREGRARHRHAPVGDGRGARHLCRVRPLCFGDARQRLAHAASPQPITDRRRLCRQRDARRRTAPAARRADRCRAPRIARAGASSRCRRARRRGGRSG